MDYALHVFKLSKPGKDGVSLAEKLDRVKGKSSKAMSALDGPECPEQAQYLMAYFNEISQGRTRGFGATPLSWLDLAAWMTVSRVKLEAIEIRLIRAIDRVWVQVFSSTEGESDG